MSDLQSSSYISLCEDFLSVPVPACQFSLFTPAQDDVHEACATLDLIDEVVNLQNLEAMTFEGPEVIDENLFNYFFGSEFSPNLCGDTNLNSGLNGSVKVKEESGTVRPSWRITLDREATIIPASTSTNTNFPCWLVGSDGKQFSKMEALDDSGNRVDFMYLCVAESKAPSGAKSDRKENGTVKPKEETEKKNKENDTKRKPLQTAKTQNVGSAVAMTTKEALSAMGITENVTLLSDKLRQHFDRLSNVDVPVLESGRSSNNVSRARRKQQLLKSNSITISAQNVAEILKQRSMSSMKELRDDRVVHTGSRPEELSRECKDENANVCAPALKANRIIKKRRVSKRILKNIKSKKRIANNNVKD